MAKSVLTSVYAPMTGRVIPLKEVPDPVFSDKILGDGIAIIPSDGKIYSPVTGTVVTIAESRHAFGFSTAEGAELLLHVGLETVALKGKPFDIKVKEGAQVKAGDLIATVDLAYLKEHNIAATTPVLYCSGEGSLNIPATEGEVKAGKTLVYTIETKLAEKKPEPAPAKAEETAPEPEKKGGFINFDLLQNLGKVLLTVIAVMPAAGLALSIGKVMQLWGGDINLVMTLGLSLIHI